MYVLFIMLEVFKKIVIQTNGNKWVVSLAMLCIAHSDAKTHQRLNILDNTLKNGESMLAINGI